MGKQSSNVDGASQCSIGPGEAGLLWQKNVTRFVLHISVGVFEECIFHMFHAITMSFIKFILHTLMDTCPRSRQVLERSPFSRLIQL